MKISLFAPLLFFALPTSSLFILLPLYVYPDSDASAWAPVTSAIAAYPSVQWQIVINPDSGPGSPPYPDINYVAGISELNSYDNVRTLGYVDTAYATRALADVKSDIDVYAGWADYTDANITVDGIFFDDATTGTTDADYTYMCSASKYAYDHIPTDTTYVIFNPGTLSPTRYFNYADTIVEFEDTYANYAGQTTIDTFPDDYLAQSAILIHDTPTTATNIGSLVGTMVSDGIGAVYFTYDCCYNSLSSTLLDQIASAV
jgi:Spherulation-specific family 4